MSCFRADAAVAATASRRRRGGGGGTNDLCNRAPCCRSSGFAGRAASLSHAQLLLLAANSLSHRNSSTGAEFRCPSAPRARRPSYPVGTRPLPRGDGVHAAPTAQAFAISTSQVLAHESRNEAPAPPRRAEQRCRPADRGPGLPARRRPRAAETGAEAEIPQQEGAEARQGEDRGQTSAGQRQPRRLEKGRRPQERAALIGSPVLVTIVTTLHSL